MEESPGVAFSDVVLHAVDSVRDMQQMLDALSERCASLRKQLGEAVQQATSESKGAVKFSHHQTHSVPVIMADSVVSEACVELSPIDETDCNIPQPVPQRRSTTQLPRRLSSFPKLSTIISNTLTVATFRDLSTTRRRDLPPDKRYHYFLSHKKLHSRFDVASEHIARSLHDALEASGYTGFFDVDRLETIDQESIREAIKASCVMIVAMTDETVKSSWCRFEWDVAEENNLNIKCMVDLTRFNKHDVLATVREYPSTTKLQWIDYTDKGRRACFHEMDTWLQKVLKGLIKVSRDTNRGPWFELAVHPLFQALLLVSGSPYTKRLMRYHGKMFIWRNVSRILTLASFALCILWVIYDADQTLLFLMSGTYRALIHIVSMYSTGLTSTVLITSSKELLEFVGESQGSDTLLKRLSRYTSIVGVLGLLAALFICVSIVLMSDQTYRIHGDIFHWLTTITFAIVFPLALIQAIAFLAFLYVTSELGVAALAESFDILDRRISLLGIKAFVSAGNLLITPHAGLLENFRSNWLNAHARMSEVQARVTLALVSHYLVHGWGVIVPLVVHYLTHSSSPWKQVDDVRIFVLWWLIAATAYLAAIIIPFSAGSAMNELRSIGRSLTFRTSEDQSRLDSLMSIDLTWKVGPFSLGGSALVLLVCPMFVSGFAFVLVIWESDWR
eukprot:TRINITY_DN14811_c0_g1_i1.p1 TRINITY_DN14811_c0_g1~~TRINITY_DN14811_c0_g1_i1.p1  ORF type:complete len:693 (+),score=74.05 TRINITY_DN14811_c0_g1_i1:58-2079(+)